MIAARHVALLFRQDLGLQFLEPVQHDLNLQSGGWAGLRLRGVDEPEKVLAIPADVARPFELRGAADL